MRNLVFCSICVVALAARPGVADPGFSLAERTLVAAILTLLQPRSFATDREFCGYVYEDRSGRHRVTGPVRGAEGTCSAPWPETGRVLASWHTHGGYDVDLWNELPSSRDVQADAFEGIDGWVATPGGRLWHVDGREMSATLVCGPGCLPADLNYDPAATGPIAPHYSYDDLLDRFAVE